MRALYTHTHTILDALKCIVLFNRNPSHEHRVSLVWFFFLNKVYSWKLKLRSICMHQVGKRVFENA